MTDLRRILPDSARRERADRGRFWSRFLKGVLDAEARVRERYAPSGASDDEREAAEDAWWHVARELLVLVPSRLLGAVARFLPR